MKKQSILKTLSMGLIGFAAVAAMSAQAANYSETVVRTSAEGLREATIAYNDLDLSSARGRETLNWRINQAARLVCGSTDYRKAGSLRQAGENKDCYHGAMAQANNQVSKGQVASISQ